MSRLTFKNISKVYPGGVNAVKDFNLEIEDREFVVFVGPSGCGKSTTLRMIAGLEDITGGELYIDGKLVNDEEPKDRDIAMVFQNYALYPHMTVYDNLAFGLRIRKLTKKQIDEKVKAAAEILGISELLKRKPKALSGGQKQRVALGRAIVREPKVFLLDEPLSNLDAKMRTLMRAEIIKLHKNLNTTFIYVTHDQVEAMTMGTKIVVMKDGEIQQVDTPDNLYNMPRNKFVASFIGTPQMNFFKALIEKTEKGVFIALGDIKLPFAESNQRKIPESYYGKEVTLGVRAEDVEILQGNKKVSSSLEAVINFAERLGNETLLYVNIPLLDAEGVLRGGSRFELEAVNSLKIRFDPSLIHLFDPETEASLFA